MMWVLLGVEWRGVAAPRYSGRHGVKCGVLPREGWTTQGIRTPEEQSWVSLVCGTPSAVGTVFVGLGWGESPEVPIDILLVISGS